MDIVRWGIVGCGDVAEVKSGPALQKAHGSRLVAVMRRNLALAQDFARRHEVPRVHARAEDLIGDPEVDAVYIATPPSTHCELSLRVAAAGKPCLVEKPMAMNHPECLRMVEAFRTRGVPLWIAYYRRALPRYRTVRELLTGGAIGRVTSARVEVMDRLVTGDRASAWRFRAAVAGAGLFLDMGSHCVDLLDFLVGEITDASGFAVNTGGTYEVEDVTAASFRMAGDVVGSGIWNFNAGATRDTMVFMGSDGELRTPIFHEEEILLSTSQGDTLYPIRNPPHVHQPLIQSIVDELAGRGRCDSTAESGARASRVLDLCLGRRLDTIEVPVGPMP